MEQLKPYLKSITVGVESTFNWYWLLDGLKENKVTCHLGDALDVMREWYAVEREAREKKLSFEDRLTMRKKKVASSMTVFKEWMQRQLLEVLPKSPMGVALQYALNQWKYFNPYLTDGRIELSNILIENAIRPVALGRKNFLFTGSYSAARWPAVIYSLAAIAKNHGVAPFEYFNEPLTELPKTDFQDIDKYLLAEWKPKPVDSDSK